MHQVKRFVDVFQAHGVGDKGVQRDFAGLGHFHVAWQFGTATHAAKRRTAPDAPGHQLEWAGGDFLASTGYTNDHRLAPTLVAALQGRAHQLHIADALEGKVHAAVGQVDDHVLDGAVVVFRVDAVGGAQLPGDFKLGRVDVDGNDATGLGFHRADDGRQANAAEAEDSHGIARLDLGSVDHRADAGGNAAAEQADLFQRRFFRDFCNGNFR